MKPVFAIALFLACLLAAAPRLRAQAPPENNAPGQNSSSSQNPPAAQNPPAGQQPSRVEKQSNGNPFPEDTSSVPVLPSKSTDELPAEVRDAARNAPMPLPSDDFDPVRSPEDAGQAAEEQERNSSSSLAGMGNLLPGPDDDTQPGKRNRKGAQIVPEHHETAAEDENVGSYYLDNKNWKAALSRFESGLVLDPDNPDVYWGLAESQRHLGDFASARANYMKVMEYDPGSRHAKEASKALTDPQIANAKPSATAQPAATSQ